MSGQCFYSTATIKGSPTWIVTFPHGVTYTLSALARRLGLPVSTIRYRLKRTTDPRVLLGRPVPGRRIEPAENWRQLLDSVDTVVSNAEVDRARALAGWGWGSVDVERYLRWPGASIDCWAKSVY